MYLLHNCVVEVELRILLVEVGYFNIFRPLDYAVGAGQLALNDFQQGGFSYAVGADYTKLFAPSNIRNIYRTFETSQSFKGWLKRTAPSNIPSILKTFDVFHEAIF